MSLQRKTTFLITAKPNKSLDRSHRHELRIKPIRFYHGACWRAVARATQPFDILLMTFRALTPLAVLTLLLVAVSSQTESQTTANAPGPASVNYCDLTRNGATYDKKQIHVRALYVVGFEAAYLYDPSCSANHTWIEFGEGYDQATDSHVLSEFRRLLKSSRQNKFNLSRVDVVFTGTFDGVKQEANLKLKNGNIFKLPPIGYGHMNGYDYQLTVRSIDDAKSVAKKTPW